MVSRNGGLADFLAEVFGLTRQPPQEAGPGVLHRLEAPGALLKVMVPKEPPADTPAVDPFYGATGLRYLTMYVDDLDATVERALARGGRLVTGPMDIRAGVRLAILGHPECTAIEVIEVVEVAEVVEVVEREEGRAG